MKKVKIAKKEVKDYHKERVESYIVNTEKDPEKYIYNVYFKNLYAPIKRLRNKGRALDLGCGAGTFTFPLAKDFEQAYGIDMTEPMLLALEKIAKKRGLKNVKGIMGDVTKMPFPDNHFDFIVGVGLMECVPDQDKVLSEIRRVLRPGGIASLRWLNRKGIWGFAEKLLSLLHISFSGPFAKNFTTPAEVKKRIRKSGLKLKSFKGMIRLPVNIFPAQIGWPLTQLLIKTGFVGFFEPRNQKLSTISRYYYAFYTELRK